MVQWVRQKTERISDEQWGEKVTVSGPRVTEAKLVERFLTDRLVDGTLRTPPSSRTDKVPDVSERPGASRGAPLLATT